MPEMLRKLWLKISDRDQAARAWVAARFPILLSIVDAILGTILNTISDNKFNLIVAFVLLVLSVTGSVSIIVSLSIAAAWFIAVLWVARADSVRKLTIPTRFMLVLVIAATLAFFGQRFGVWALSTYRVQQQSKLQVPPQPALTKQATTPQTAPETPRKSTRQPKKMKQEESVQEDVRNELKLIFNNSPLFTDARKQRIARDMNLFYLYLIQVGFNAPKEVPTLGTYTKYMWIGGSQPIYEHSIFISERDIDDPSYIARMYARYAFNALLKESSPEEKHGIRDNKISEILEDYFIASYSNKPPSLIGSSNWLAALWEIRQKYGKYYTDKMMCFAFKSMIEYRSKEDYKDFDLYFKHYLLHGASILENDRRNLQTFQDVEKIIKSHVQMPSK